MPARGGGESAHCYRIAGQILASAVQLPELLKAEGQPDFTLTESAAPLPDPAESSWYLTVAPDAEERYRLAHDRNGYFIRFRNLADFRLREQRFIEAYRYPGTGQDTFRHILLDQVIPMVMAERGCLVIHASAVWVSEGIVAFAGAGGSGKSSLAASFADAGYPPMADDFLPLRKCGGRVCGTPSYPGLRLWEDAVEYFSVAPEMLSSVAHYSTKRRTALASSIEAFARLSQRDLPVLAIFLVSAQPERIAIEPLAPQAAGIELLQSAFRLSVGRKEALLAEFEQLAAAMTVPVFRLSFPMTWEALPEVRRMILDRVTEGGQGRSRNPDPAMRDR